MGGAVLGRLRERGGSLIEGLQAHVRDGGDCTEEETMDYRVVREAFMMGLSLREVGCLCLGFFNALGISVVVSARSWNLMWTPNRALHLHVDRGGAQGGAVAGWGMYTLGQVVERSPWERAAVDMLLDDGSSKSYILDGCCDVGLGGYSSDAGGAVAEERGYLVSFGETTVGGACTQAVKNSPRLAHRDASSVLDTVVARKDRL